MIGCVLGKLLSLFRYRNTPDPFRLFTKLRQGEQLPAKCGKSVLVLPIRVSPVSNLLEGLYGYAMRLRGYTVHSLVCGGALKKCDNRTILTDDFLRCSLCKYEQSRFASTFSLVNHYFKDLLDSDTINVISSIIDSTPPEELFSLEYDGTFIGNHIEMSVVRYLLSSKVVVAENVKLLKEFAFSTIISYEVTKRLIEKVKPEFVLLSHGVYSTWGGALAACKSSGVPAVIWGRGYIKGNIIADHDESYIFNSITESQEYWKGLVLKEEQKNELERYFVNKKNPKKTDDYVNYYADISPGPEVGNKLGRRSANTQFALFPNIPWDGTTFSSSKEFPSVKHFLSATIKWFMEHSQYDLYIRAHPAEIADKYNLTQETTKDILDSIAPTLPSNIIYIPPESNITSYDVADMCDVNLLFASTIGLELSYQGKIVIQTGQSMISSKGFIYEAKSLEEYYALIEMAVTRRLSFTPSMRDNVDKYSYHWLYRRHIPENLYTHRSLTFTGYNIKSSMDLAPGQNDTVDWFIERCLDGKPFVWDGHEKLLQADNPYASI